MSNYKDIQNLIQKYSTKQPQEKWSSVANHKYRNWKILEEQLRLFGVINSNYFRLKGSQQDRAIHLIKVLNFNKICPRCTNEQMIVLICYYVKCEYVPNYERRRCQRAFDEFNVTDNLLDKFMVYLANMNLSELSKRSDFNV